MPRDLAPSTHRRVRAFTSITAIRPERGLTTLGRYTVTSRLAVGGMAEVFAATMSGVEGFVKPVVVKRLLPHLCSRPEFVRLFLNEARIAAQFSHPNLAQVYELFEANGNYCIAMEQLDGLDLHILQRRLPSRTLPSRAVAEIVASVAAGLQVAHTSRDPAGQPVVIIHRDVSPTNVVMTRAGVVKLVDFGVAKLLDTQSATSRRGKPRYMSPEQISGAPLDARTDLFSLGAVAYELLTGVPCFDGDTVLDVAAAINEGRYRALRDAAPDCEAELAQLIERLLAVDREARPASADAVRRKAREILQGIAPPGYALLDDIRAETFATPLAKRPSTDRQPSVTVCSTPTRPATAMATEELRSYDGPISKSVRRPAGARGTALLTLLALAGAAFWGREVGHDAVPTVTTAAETTRPTSALPATVIATAPAEGLEPTQSVQANAVSAPQRRPPAKARAQPAPVSVQTPGIGSLVVNSEPWSEVYLDGVDVGMTPLALRQVGEGEHELVLRNDDAGLHMRRAIRVKHGETTKTFEKLAGAR